MASRIWCFSTAISRNGGAQVFVRNARNVFVVIAAVMAAFDAGAHQLHAQAAPSAQAKKMSRLDRLEAWIAAIDQHTPGEADEAVLEVNRWTSEDLRGVWIDVA